MSIKKTLLGHCCEILGQSIFEHELFKDRPHLHYLLKQCADMREVVALMKKMHQKEYGFVPSLPGNRRLYWQHKWENARPLPTKKKPKKPNSKKRSIVADYFTRTYGSQNTPSKKIVNEHELYLQHQTMEQFELAKKHGWRIAKLLTEPDGNFHYEE